EKSKSYGHSSLGGIAARPVNAHGRGTGAPPAFPPWMKGPGRVPRACATRASPARFPAGQLVHQAIGAVDRSQGLEDSPRIDGDRSGLPVVVAEVQDQRLDVAVEDQADDLVVAIDDRTPRVPADDVGRRHEVQGGIPAELPAVAGLDPA